MNYKHTIRVKANFNSQLRRSADLREYIFDSSLHTHLMTFHFEIKRMALGCCCFLLIQCSHCNVGLVISVGISVYQIMRLRTADAQAKKLQQ